MIQSRPWLLFFLFFCPFVLAIPVDPIPRSRAGEDTLISAYSPSFIVPELAPVSEYYTTRFTHRPSEGLAPVSHINRFVLTTRRKIEFFFRFVTETILPEIRPTREAFVYLRSLEDPLFMSARELLPTSDKAARSADSIPILNIRDILNSLESELEKRSISDRQRITNDLNEIVQRMPSTSRDDTSL